MTCSTWPGYFASAAAFAFAAAAPVTGEPKFGRAPRGGVPLKVPLPGPCAAADCEGLFEPDDTAAPATARAATAAAPASPLVICFFVMCHKVRPMRECNAR